MTNLINKLKSLTETKTNIELLIRDLNGHLEKVKEEFIGEGSVRPVDDVEEFINGSFEDLMWNADQLNILDKVDSAINFDGFDSVIKRHTSEDGVNIPMLVASIRGATNARIDFLAELSCRLDPVISSLIEEINEENRKEKEKRINEVLNSLL